VSEYSAVGLRYNIRLDSISPFGYYNPIITAAALQGSATTSSVGYSFTYNTLDDALKPHKGVTFELDQDFAGFGGNVKYIRTVASYSYHHPVLWDDFIGKLSLSAGYIDGFDNEDIRLEDRFFRGGDTFRGFQIGGIGPRETSLNGNNALGGDAYAIGSAELRLPDFLPADYGVGMSLFSDFGTLGHLDSYELPHGLSENCSPFAPQNTVCIKDNMALRVSTGLAVSWKSPFGPVQIDFGIPVVREPYDKSQILYFSAGTGL
jgi:outer membrane protein insertion porin family